MKTEEDEAFDELAKRQGAWGGGFQAKQAMAADKLQEPIYNITVFDNAYPKGIPLEDWVQPPQEPEMQTGIAYQKGFHDGKQAALAQPAQEPFGWYSAREDEFMTHKIHKEHERLNSYTHINGKFDLPLYTASPLPAQPAQEPSATRPCRSCDGTGECWTGIDEAPTSICKPCNGTGKMK